MDTKNTELIKQLNSLEPSTQQKVKGLIMFKLKIGFATLYRRLKTGFQPHEITDVEEALKEFTAPAN